MRKDFPDARDKAPSNAKMRGLMRLLCKPPLGCSCSGGMTALGASLAIPSHYTLGQDAKLAVSGTIDTHQSPPKVAIEGRAALEKVAPSFEAVFFTRPPGDRSRRWTKTASRRPSYRGVA
jgi:hypothetical protein